MRWTNKSSRKRDGWVERKRQFQKMFAETTPTSLDQKAPVIGETDSSETRLASHRGGK